MRTAIYSIVALKGRLRMNATFATMLNFYDMMDIFSKCYDVIGQIDSSCDLVIGKNN